MKAILCTAGIIVGLIALRMLFMNPVWLLLPKRWQRWLFSRSYSPFKAHHHGPH